MEGRLIPLLLDRPYFASSVAPGAITWAVSALNANRAEGNSGTTSFTFTVARSGTGAGNVAATINWAVSVTTANAADFGGTLPSGSLSFAVGETSKTLTVGVSGDTTVEPDETFTVTLSNPSVGSVFTASAPAVILDDDTVTQPGSKPTTAPVLQAKGLSLIWQDRLGESDEPTDSHNFFSPYLGSRNGSSDHGITDNRLSVVTFDGKRCLRESYLKNKPIILNYRSQRLPQRYSEMGLCCDVFYPSNFALIPASTPYSSLGGKTVFGLLLGHENFFKPGMASTPWQRGSICWSEDMTGSEAGVNFAYRYSSSQMEYSWYPHTVGAYVNGQHKMRNIWDRADGAYSHPPPGYTIQGANPNIAKGQWVRIEIYGKMDTDRTNGTLELWVDGVRKLWWPNLDLGGWVGDRGLYKGKNAPAAPAGSVENWQTQPNYSFGTGPLANDCPSSYRTLGGFRFIGIFMRAMGGGWSIDTPYIPVNQDNYGYYYNWRVYGKL